MDPNNNQQINTQQPQQPVGIPTQEPAPAIVPPPTAVPVASPPVAPTPIEPVVPAAPPITPTPAVPATMPTTAPKSGGKGLALLIILLILVLGMAAYVFFVKNQINSEQKTADSAKTVVVPTATITPIPTPASVDEVQVDDPTMDLNALDTDVSGL
jgi:hypothetical protein